jgi:hypothetical protein
VDFDKLVERIMEPFFYASPEGFNRVEFGRIRGHENRLDAQLLQKLFRKLGSVRPMIVHY